MIFEIDYSTDITFVWCEEFETCTIVVADDYGYLRNIDTYCDHAQMWHTIDPYEAIERALSAAEYCTKSPPGERVVFERGDKTGFYRGVRTPLGRRLKVRLHPET